MIRRLSLATTLIALAAFASPVSAQQRHATSLDANGNLDALIARHAVANTVPESMVRRVIRRDSGGNPRTVHAGSYCSMQIRLGTAHAMGYRGSAAGLLDPNTKLTYTVKILARACRAAGGNADRAVHYYYAAGYYCAVKRKTRSHKNAREPMNAYTL